MATDIPAGQGDKWVAKAILGAVLGNLGVYWLEILVSSIGLGVQLADPIIADLKWCYLPATILGGFLLRLVFKWPRSVRYPVIGGINGCIVGSLIGLLVYPWVTHGTAPRFDTFFGEPGFTYELGLHEFIPRAPFNIGLLWGLPGGTLAGVLGGQWYFVYRMARVGEPEMDVSAARVGKLRRLHWLTFIIMAVATSPSLWLNMKPPFDWERQVGSHLPFATNPDLFTRAMFYKGWPHSPCEYGVIHGMRIHPAESNIQFAFWIDVSLIVAVAVVSGTVSEWLIRLFRKWRGLPKHRSQ